MHPHSGQTNRRARLTWILLAGRVVTAALAHAGYVERGIVWASIGHR